MAYPYAPIPHGKLKGIDYRASRPFKDWRKPNIELCVGEWLSLNPPRLELATMALDELRGRGANRARKVEELFQASSLLPIGWLKEARATSTIRCLPGVCRCT